MNKDDKSTNEDEEETESNSSRNERNDSDNYVFVEKSETPVANTTSILSKNMRKGIKFIYLWREMGFLIG